MRDRLVKMLAEGRELCEKIQCEGCRRSCKGLNDCIANVQAEHLLANGVIVPPCKVGDTVYHLTSVDTHAELGVIEIFEGKVCSVSKDEKDLWLFCRYDNGLNYWYTEMEIGKTVFLTREEAEQALKGEHHAEIH